MRTSISTIAAVLATLVSLASVPSAHAGDIQGDAYSCEELWVMRNQIFKTAGYCFKTEKAITYFGNGGCTFDNQNDVPLSDMDRIVIRDARLSEKRQGC